MKHSMSCALPLTFSEGLDVFCWFLVHALPIKNKVSLRSGEVMGTTQR